MSDQERAASETPDAVLATVTGVLREILGPEWLEDLEITAETSFNDDLELESIEFVALAERIQEIYGEEVDFVGWLSDKGLDEIIALTVGDLVGFITHSAAA